MTKRNKTKTKDGHVAYEDEDDCFMVDCPKTGATEHQREKGMTAHCTGCGKALFKFKVEAL